LESCEIIAPREASVSGFTLIELCVVIVAVAMVGMTVLPALARARPNTRVSQCLDNARQLAATVQMYTVDNHDMYPPNPGDGTVLAGYNWCGGSTEEAFDPDILTNNATCLVAPYLNRNSTVFSCPADPRYGLYDGSQFNLFGTRLHAVRSVSMNGSVGTIDPGALTGGAHGGVPNTPAPGWWLTGVHGGNSHDNPWATFGKTADFRVVKPSQIFLITDEDPYSINDAYLSVSAGTAEFVDYPATFHDHGCTMSFCDGHVELHRWTGSLIILNSPFPKTQTVPPGGSDYADWTWLWQHSTVRMK
jgi:prepilin-type processing-associated H-X9-DG protein